MQRAKLHKAHDKSGRSPTAGRQKQQEETIDILIHGLDTLTAQAESADMGTAARILYTAKEELVHWAVNMNFHESAQERFVNRRLYQTHLSAVEELIMRALKGARAAKPRARG